MLAEIFVLGSERIAAEYVTEIAEQYNGWLSYVNSEMLQWQWHVGLA